MTRPCRRITLHLSQIFLTLGWTFTSVASPSFWWCAGGSRSLVAVHDAATGEVVRRELNDDPVLRQDADVVLPHLAADVCEHPVTVLELHPEHRIRQRLDYPALYLERPVLLGHILRDS